MVPPEDSDGSGGAPASVNRREQLAELAERGDAAAIAQFLLAEGLVAHPRPGQPDSEVLGRTADLLAQHAGDSLALVGWIAAVANGVTHLEGIEDWAHRALREAADDATTRPVLWSEIRPGDLVVARCGARVRAGVALDSVWGVHVGPSAIERIALVDLVDGSDGPRVLRDKLWFWSSFGAPHRDHEVASVGAARDRSAPRRPTGSASQARAALWLGGAATVLILALVFGLVVLGDGRDRSPLPPAVNRSALFPLDQLALLDSTVGDTDLRLCSGGVPGAPYTGDLVGIRIRGVDTYRFDADTLLVDVVFLEPLDRSLQVLARRAVRGYAVDRDGVAIGTVQAVEVTPSGEEIRGRLTLGGELLEGSGGTVAVARGFQFLLDLEVLGHPDAVQVAVDSLGGASGELDRIPCHLVVTEPIQLR